MLTRVLCPGSYFGKCRNGHKHRVPLHAPTDRTEQRDAEKWEVTKLGKTSGEIHFPFCDGKKTFALLLG